MHKKKNNRELVSFLFLQSARRDTDIGAERATSLERTVHTTSQQAHSSTYASRKAHSISSSPESKVLCHKGLLDNELLSAHNLCA